MPPPTPPAAETSEVERWSAIMQISLDGYMHHGVKMVRLADYLASTIAAEVLRREAALRERLNEMLAHEDMERDRANAAEAEVERLCEAIRLHAEETTTDEAWGGSGSPLMPHDQRLWEAIGLDDPFAAARAKEKP